MKKLHKCKDRLFLENRLKALQKRGDELFSNFKEDGKAIKLARIADTEEAIAFHKGICTECGDGLR